MKTAPSHPSDDWTILSLIEWTANYFNSNQIDSPRSTAEILLAHFLDISRIELYLRYDQPLNRDERDCYKRLIRRRIKREPVAYIVGEKEFWSLSLTINRHVLIPRPETECLVARVLDDIPKDSKDCRLRILEIGVGSGAILCALATQRPGHLFIGSDISAAAVTVTRDNLKHHGAAESTHLVCADLFSSLNPRNARFDIIVSNPPYINSDEIDGLQPEIALYEPLEALDGGEDGLALTSRLIKTAAEFLKPGGVLAFEIGYDQFEAVGRMAQSTGTFEKIEVSKDFSGLDRVVRMVKTVAQTDPQ